MPRKFLSFLLISALLASVPVGSFAKTVEELQEELKQKREELKQTEANISKFKQEIQLKKREARTLQDQITLIDDNIGEVELNLKKTNTEIEQTMLEISEVEAEIGEREAEIKIEKGRLAEYIRAMNNLDQQSAVTIFLKYDTFSDAFNEVATFEELQQRGQETLVAIKHLREELELKQRDLEDYKQSLSSLKKRQEGEQISLETQRSSKSRILELTNEKEKEYQQLLKQASSAHQKAQSDIGRLDTLIREELKKQGIGNLPSVGIFSWPVTPEFGVSCEFHCPDYPYAYLIGPHTGMDIPVNVGTPIKAPADGYVARVYDAKGPGYSYIMLLHGDNVTTVYGHVSGFAVNEGSMVTRGTVIGYTGGAPGMNGAGLSTGPHLHFEVRSNNAPVNPRKYL